MRCFFYPFFQSYCTFSIYSYNSNQNSIIYFVSDLHSINTAYQKKERVKTTPHYFFNSIIIKQMQHFTYMIVLLSLCAVFNMASLISTIRMSPD